MKPTSNKQLDFLLVNLVVHKEKPNFDVALIHKRKYQVNKNTNKFDLFSQDQYAKFGPGSVLFFQLLKSLTLLFAILFINSIPMLLCNLKGNGLSLYSQKQGPQFQISLMKFSLANQPFIKVNPKQSVVQNVQTSTQMNRIITIVNDLYLTCIILMFFAWWQYKSKDIVQKIIRSQTLPSYKTLIISEIDCIQQQKMTQRYLIEQNQQNQFQQRIRRHFQKFGKVQQVSLVYDYKQFLINLRQFIQICKKYSVQLKFNKKQQLYKQIVFKYTNLKQIYFQNTSQCFLKKHTVFYPIKCFVTFQNVQTRNRVKALYKYQVRKQQLKINHHLPKIQKCRTQPMSIIWQNFHLKDSTQFKKAIIFGLFISVILFVSLIAILLLSVKMAELVDTKNSFNALNSTKQFLQQQIKFPTYFQALNSNNPKTVFNFCSQIDYKSFHIEYYTLCEEYFTNFSQKILSMLMLSTMIAIINFIFNKIVYALAEYRRHRTITQKNSFLIGNIFLVYFVNTVLLVLLIRAEFGNFNDENISSLIDIVKKLFPHFQTLHKIQTYPQFNRKWYMHIGNQLIFNYTVSLILSPWLYLIIYYIFDKLNNFISKMAKTQIQMNKMIEPQQFDFQTFYALTLNSFFFCLTFSTGIPFFYLLGFFSFGSLYLSSKLTFQYFSKMPLPFDHSLNSFIFRLLILGLVIHQFSAIFFVYVEDIFQSTENKLQKRVFYIIMISLILIFYVYKKNISKIFFSFDRPKNNRINFSDQICKQESIRSKQVHNLMKIEDFNQFSKFSRLDYLKSYKMQDNQAYNQICYALLVFKKVVIQHRDITKQFLPIKQLKQINQIPQKKNIIESNLSKSNKNQQNLQELSYRQEYGKDFLID